MRARYAGGSAVLFDVYGHKVCPSCSRLFMSMVGWNTKSRVCNFCKVHGCPDCVKHVAYTSYFMCKECLEID